jgi:hypothetical protein
MCSTARSGPRAGCGPLALASTRCPGSSPDLKDEPIKVVAKLGGWRDLETLLRYQRVTDDDPRATLWARGAPPARPGTADAAV